MKANDLIKANITELLAARRHSQKDLAVWCRRKGPWLSKILTNDAREMPTKYYDRIADFFGLATYQLFQPGISPLTERRKGQDRRGGQDRRISARRADLPAVRQLSVTPEDEAMLVELHALDYETYQRVKGWIAVARFGRSSGRGTAPPADPPPATSSRSGRGPRTPRTPTNRRGHTPPKP